VLSPYFTVLPLLFLNEALAGSDFHLPFLAQHIVALRALLNINTPDRTARKHPKLMVARFIDELRSTGEKEPLTRRLGKASLTKIVEVEQPVGFVPAQLLAMVHQDRCTPVRNSDFHDFLKHRPHLQHINRVSVRVVPQEPEANRIEDHDIDFLIANLLTQTINCLRVSQLWHLNLIHLLKLIMASGLQCLDVPLVALASTAGT